MRMSTWIWGLGLAGLVGSGAYAAPPNIVLCVADDWGWPHAGAYGDQGIQTPHFDRIAAEGARFEQAYVTSPSCTPSRNSLITGKYFWQLGAGASLWSTLPEEHRSFVHLLRDAGYVTGRAKPKSWGPGNIQSWVEHHGDHPVTAAYRTFDEFLEKTDAPDKPFFFWLSTSDPHRAYDPGSGERAGIDPAKVHLFDHYPDVPEVRTDVADYYFEVQRWDRLVGTMLAALERAEVLEDTVVIMTGDHGMPFPRCKGNLYDSGVRVPFAVRWSDGIRPGRVIEDFVSFADVAPTLLELAGLPVPGDMTGSSFARLLAGQASGRLDPEGRPDIVFGRERHTVAQEMPDTGGYPSRGIRTPEYLYIRNYRPGRWPAGTPNSERTRSGNQWYADCDGSPTKTYMVENRDVDEAHRRGYRLSFAKRPAEELYDLRTDPGQLVNLAEDSTHAETLAGLRARLQQRQTDLHDPRAAHPDDDHHFEQYPYLGGGGGKRPPTVPAPTGGPD